MQKFEVVYLEHPVSQEEKRRLNKEGKRIVDIRFAPDDVKKSKREVVNKKRKSSGSYQVKADGQHESTD